LDVRRETLEAAGLGTPTPVETLDGLVERLCLPKVDFIKIDVETMELEVLRGGRRTLQGFRPVVLFETMEWARAYRQQVSGINVFLEMAALLQSLDYTTCELARDGTTREVSLSSAPLNPLAVPKSRQ
jgi:hypothetical protein